MAAQQEARATEGVGVFTVLTGAMFSDRAPPQPERVMGPSEAVPKPCLVLVLPATFRLVPRVLIQGIRKARETIRDLSAIVLGAGVKVDRLRRCLDQRGYTGIEVTNQSELSLGQWNATIARATVIGVVSETPTGDPVADLAWLAGKPVIPFATDRPDALSRAIIAAVLDSGRRERLVRAGAAVAARRLAPAGVAAGLMRAFLTALDRKIQAPAPRLIAAKPLTVSTRKPTPLGFPELRSRLTLMPLSAREVLAEWTLRRDDWQAALDWLGPDAARAVLTLRLFDITDLMFNGQNAHNVWDVELGRTETFQTIGLHTAGRSLAACLGVRSQWGYFHAITHSRICHLPREELAALCSPIQRLRALPRRS
jgi:hypothetical protein